VRISGFNWSCVCRYEVERGECSIDDPECEVFECQDLFDEPNLNEISFFSYCEPRLGITFYF
jgi:hypothetical protein